ncbi:MAG TPA: hypothetical protein PLH91_00590 [Tenuifilaceae bacterium]|jgi:hypothetical protein|nr:hypothetical protein [Tenuifilaceae bacterium]
MKNSLIFFLALLPLFSTGQNVSIKEPEFIGNVVFVNDTIGEGLPLEYQKATLKVKSNSATYIPFANLAAGKTSSNYIVSGIQSSLIVRKNNNLQFVLRYSSNDEDPRALIKVYKFKTDKKNRFIEVYKVSSMGKQQETEDVNINFKASKYGDNSYLINIPSLEVGEYGITTIEGNFYLFSVSE